MLEYTLHLSDNNPSAKALLEYIKTLDFAKLSPTKDWYDELSNEQKEGIEVALQELKEGKGIPHDDVVNKINKRITRNG
jgi:hypothetical protein